MAGQKTQIEVEWVRRIRGGDGAAFESLFRHYCQPLVRFACRYVGDPSVAENLVQDVFLAVWTQRARLDPDANIKTYLFTAAKNRALKHRRHAEVEQRGADAARQALRRPPTPADEWRQKEIAAAIDQAVAALPEKTRTLFAMNRFDRLTYAEIAEIQGVSVKTVETLMGRALRSLRDRLAHLL